MRTAVVVSMSILFVAGVHAEEITCKGSITSIQGEGLVARPHRFDVSEVKGVDIQAVLENCKKIAQEHQNRSARRNPGGNFRKLSDVDLQCVQGTEKFQLRRAIRTSP